MFRCLSALLLALCLTAPAAFAQQLSEADQKMAALRAEVAQGKQAYVSRQLTLNSAEQAAFWPVYDEVQEGLASLAERRRANAAAYVSVVVGAADEDDAEDVTAEALAIERDQAKLFERAYKDLSKGLSSKQSMAYLQLEARLVTLLRYELAASLP
ncbi:hypothetical protein [Arenimonas alkanexedens]